MLLIAQVALLASVAYAKYEGVKRPVAIFHGIDDSCNGIREWVWKIQDALDYAVPVKCVEIGSGRLSSIFEMIPW